MFVGVEFCGDGNEIAIILDSWLTPTKSNTFWPPYKAASKIEKTLIQKVPADSKTWKKCSVKRELFRYGVYSF